LTGITIPTAGSEEITVRKGHHTWLCPRTRDVWKRKRQRLDLDCNSLVKMDKENTFHHTTNKKKVIITNNFQTNEKKLNFLNESFAD
jgi:hypothetical protein